MTNIKEISQMFNADTIVHLYTLDASSIGGGIYRFTNMTDNGQPVCFGGVKYQPIDFEAEGFEWNGRDTLPTPHIKVSNVNRIFSALVIDIGDGVGSGLYRVRTFRRFLDGQPEADSNAHFPIDIYTVERKVHHNKQYIEWELSAAMDQQGRMLPGRQILRDT